MRVLSDERIILREEDGEIWMYGTPWHGDGHIAEPGRARLDRVFFLRHGPRNALTAVPSASDRRAPLRLRLHPVPRRGRPRLQPGLPGRGRAARALRRAGVRSRPQRGRVRARLVALRRRTPDVRNRDPMDSFKPSTTATDGSSRSSRWIEALSAPSPTACSPLGSSSVSLPRVRVDVNRFRDRKDDSFLDEVRSVADKVRTSGQAIKLDPMNSYQRRLVHNLFKDDPAIRTWSPEDESRMKRITLLPRKSTNFRARNRPVRVSYSSHPPRCAFLFAVVGHPSLTPYKQCQIPINAPPRRKVPTAAAAP